jgi:hypothetical protein
LKNLTEPADGPTLCVKRQTQCTRVASSATPLSVSLCTRLPACLSVRPSLSCLKISPAKSKQITHGRQITSCCLIDLETNALSELANCVTVISWSRTYVHCVSSAFHAALPFQIIRIKPLLHNSPPPPPHQIMQFSINRQ